jgi:membrane protein DedA with SNARE-associated domain
MKNKWLLPFGVLCIANGVTNLDFSIGKISLRIVWGFTAVIIGAICLYHIGRRGECDYGKI